MDPIVQRSTEPIRIAVVFDRNLKSGRDIVAGIYRYAGTTRDWELFFLQKATPAAELTSAVRKLKPAGLLVDGELAMLAPNLAKDFPCMPIVAVDGLPPSEMKGFAAVQLLCDDAPISDKVGRLLVQRGFHNFGFVGTNDVANHRHSKARETAFKRAVAQHGRVSVVQIHDAVGFRRQNAMPVLEKWVRSLPKPCGVMAYNDTVAQSVAEVCRRIKVAIPESVAIVGVDDDDLICESTIPTLTSVHPDFEGAGYIAATRLANLVARQERPKRCKIVRYGVGHITERQSTRSTIGRMARVAAALEMVRLKASDGLSARAIAESLGVTARTLEMDFAAVAERPLRDYLVDARVDAVKRIASAGRKHSRIDMAIAAGFRTESAMRTAFRMRVGMSIRDYLASPNSGAGKLGCRDKPAP